MSDTVDVGREEDFLKQVTDLIIDVLLVRATNSSKMLLYKKAFLFVPCCLVLSIT